jgi:hypothetical protein
MKAERRTCRRFAVPGATVDWRTDPPGESYGSESHLADLSRGGARFVAAGPPPPGSRLRLKIQVPGEEPFDAAGQVAWSSVTSGQLNDVGVVFAPFGEAPRANPERVLDRLIALEARFASAPA